MHPNALRYIRLLINRTVRLGAAVLLPASASQPPASTAHSHYPRRVRRGSCCRRSSSMRISVAPIWKRCVLPLIEWTASSCTDRSPSNAAVRPDRAETCAIGRWRRRGARRAAQRTPARGAARRAASRSAGCGNIRAPRSAAAGAPRDFRFQGRTPALRDVSIRRRHRYPARYARARAVNSGIPLSRSARRAVPSSRHGRQIRRVNRLLRTMVCGGTSARARVRLRCMRPALIASSVATPCSRESPAAHRIPPSPRWPMPGRRSGDQLLRARR